MNKRKTKLDYKLADIFYNSRHIQRLNHSYRYYAAAKKARTIYTIARNSKKRDIYAESPPKNNGFQKGIYNIHLGLYRIYPIYGMMEKCFRDQENMY